MEETGFSEKKLLMMEKNRGKSYGTIVQTSRGLMSPTTTTIRHDVAPDDTLQGISLKYGVKVSTYSCLILSVLTLSLSQMEDIRRANRLLPTDSIFMRAYLLIPVDEESEVLKRSPVVVVRSHSLASDVASSGSSRSTTEPITDPDEENRRDIENFLSKVDSSIASSKRNLEETRKHSDFIAPGEPDTTDGTSRISYEGAYQSLNRANTQHPDKRRIRSSLHRLEKQHDELYEL